MNNCPKCGTSSQQGDVFCRVCGAKLINDVSINTTAEVLNSEKNISSSNQNTISNEIQDTSTMPNATSNINNNQNINQSNTIQIDEDQDLIDAYINKNIPQLKDRNFSLCTFFFGFIYVLYRKMWLLGFAWLIIDLITSMFLSSLYVIISIIVKVIICIKFKDLYIKNVKEQVVKIKEENPNKTKEELINLCRKKGGTTIIPVVVIVIIFILIIVACISIILNKIGEELNHTLPKDISPEEIEALNVYIPSSFSTSDEFTSNNYRMYTMNKEGDFCTLSFRTTDGYLYENNAKTYLEKNIFYTASDKHSGISPVSINNNNWYYSYVTNSYGFDYYYAITKNEKIYEVEFNIVNDTNKNCSKAHDTIINSLRFE